MKYIMSLILLASLLLLSYFVNDAKTDNKTSDNFTPSEKLVQKDSEQISALSLSNRLDDTAPSRVTGKFRKGSHVKLFLPYLPYLAITHSVNGTLVRPANSDKGWEFYLAESYTHVDNRIFEFKLRRGVKFQDGTPFNADAVVRNMHYFKKKPFTYSKLCKIFDRVEKIDNYTVRFILSEPDGVFLQDLANIPFYTEPYLKKHGWNGKSTYANLAEPGPFGLGPYILTEGYVEGDGSTKKVVLKANPNHWEKGIPKIETITIYTAIELGVAADQVLYSEGLLDITPISFNNEVETINSPYAKLLISPSTNNYAVHLNLINGNKALRDDKIRFAINRSIDQEMLLNLSMLGEGSLSPTMVSPNFYKLDTALGTLDNYFKKEDSQFTGKNRSATLRKIVTDYQKREGLDPEKPLVIRMLTPESFLFLARDIRYFLSQINIHLEIDVVQYEKTVFKQLFGTHKNKNDKEWDFLIWANFDWFRHPWTAFFVYRPNNAWSSIPANPTLSKYCDDILRVDPESAEYIPLVASFIRYVYKKNYMVFLPTPHNIYACNKEVVYNPRRSAFIPLWELEVTDLHWSIRDDVDYPNELKRPYKTTRKKLK